MTRFPLKRQANKQESIAGVKTPDESNSLLFFVWFGGDFLVLTVGVIQTFTGT